MVQTIIYPAYHSIDALVFKDWHAKYSGQITKIVGPLMLLQISLASMLALFEFGWLTVIHLLLVASTWAITFFVSIPIHRTLNEVGKDPIAINKLIETNWSRTVIWTLVFILSLIIAFQQSLNGQRAFFWQ